MNYKALTNPDTFSPVSLKNLYFFTSFFATLEQNSFFGFGLWQNMLLARTRTISLRIGGTNARFLSSSLSSLIHCMIAGGQQLGIVNSLSRSAAEDRDTSSSDTQWKVELLISLPKGLHGLRGVQDFLDKLLCILA